MLGAKYYLILGEIAEIQYPIIFTNSADAIFYGSAREGKWRAYDVRADRMYITNVDVTREHLNLIKQLTGIKLTAGSSDRAYYNSQDLKKDAIEGAVKPLA